MMRHLHWAGLFALSLVAAACGSDVDGLSLSTDVAAGSGAGGGMTDGGAPDAEPTDAGPSTDSGADSGPKPDPAEPFFEGAAMPEIRITLPQPSIDGLNANPKAYVTGDVEVHLGPEIIALGSVGVRLKGNYGSFRTLDQKAAFLLKFDEFKKKQTLLGLEKLALNNMVQDRSMIRESLAYDLFRAGDVPAPRSAYATVWINKELYGLYATVEATDNPGFLNTWFGSDEGNLYEGSYGSDLEPWLLGTFDQDNGDDVGYADLQELTDKLDAIANPATFVAEASKVIDLDRYLAFAATEIFLGHWDGYAWTRNNYFVYRRPDDGRWTWIPWGTDQTFEDYLDPWGGGGRLQQMCDASLECRLKLEQAFKDVMARVTSLDMIGDAGLLKAAIWDAAEADPRKEYDMGSISSTIDATIDFLKNRPVDVQSRLVCADPSSVDGDMDGHDGCGSDCDDGDPSVHPGAAEVCNLSDDDCDGVWDNDPMCPSCSNVALATGGTLALCFVPKTFDDAEIDCAAQGGHLASIHDQVTQDLMASEAFVVADDSWWIGLHDQAVEGKYVWTDKTPVDFTQWAGGEPNNAGGNENCAHIANWAGALWNDIPCDSALRYICLLP